MNVSGVSSSGVFCNFSSNGAVIVVIGISFLSSDNNLSILNDILNEILN